MTTLFTTFPIYSQGFLVTTDSAVGAIEIRDTSVTDIARYLHSTRIQPESFASFNVVQLVSSVGTLHATRHTQWSAIMFDGAFFMGWGSIDIGTVGRYQIGLISNGAFVANIFGGPVLLDEDVYYDVEVRKFGTEKVQLLIDGEIVQESLYSVFVGATTSTQFVFGSSNTLVDTVIGRVKQAVTSCRRPRTIGVVEASPATSWKRLIASSIRAPVTPFLKVVMLGSASTYGSPWGLRPRKTFKADSTAGFLKLTYSTATGMSRYEAWLKQKPS